MSRYHNSFQIIHGRSFCRLHENLIYKKLQHIPSSNVRSLVPREHLQLRLIQRLQLRARQTRRNLAQRLGQTLQNIRHRGQSTQEIRLSLRGELESQASEVVTLEERVGVHGASGQVVDFGSCEGVGFAGVAADGGEFGVLSDGVGGVGEEVG